MTTQGTPPTFSPIQINFGSSSLPIPQADVAVAPTSFDAVDFAYRLSRLSTFLPAAHELLSVLIESNYIITRKVCIFFLLSLLFTA